MELTADLIDWAWASSAQSPEHFCSVMLEDDAADEHFGTSCFDVPGGWSSSVALYYEIGAGLIAGAPGRDRDTWLTVMDPSRLPDDLGVCRVVDEGYIGSIAPDRVSDLARRFAETNVEAMLPLVVEHSTAREPSSPAVIRHGFDQWTSYFLMGARARMGMLIHQG